MIPPIEYLRVVSVSRGYDNAIIEHIGLNPTEIEVFSVPSPHTPNTPVRWFTLATGEEVVGLHNKIMEHTFLKGKEEWRAKLIKKELTL